MGELRTWLVTVLLFVATDFTGTFFFKNTSLLSCVNLANLSAATIPLTVKCFFPTVCLPFVHHVNLSIKLVSYTNECRITAM